MAKARIATRFAIHALFTDDANLIVILVARLLPQIIYSYQNRNVCPDQKHLGVLLSWPQNFLFPLQLLIRYLKTLHERLDHSGETFANSLECLPRFWTADKPSVTLLIVTQLRQCFLSGRKQKKITQQRRPCKKSCRKHKCTLCGKKWKVNT